MGNRILEYAFSNAGFKVINIGVLSSQEDFIEAAIETDADAILISSLYGHAEIDCRGFREKCMEAGIGDIIIYVGGNLGLGKQDWESVKSIFLDMGFDRVYPPGTLPDEAVNDLITDLENL
ncbi:methylaspartate mutase sigma subunit [Desulfitispora alkaliphila]